MWGPSLPHHPPQPRPHFPLCPINSAPRPLRSHIPHSGSSKLSSSNSHWDVTCPGSRFPRPGMPFPPSPSPCVQVLPILQGRAQMQLLSQNLKIHLKCQTQKASREHPTNPSFCGWGIRGTEWRGSRASRLAGGAVLGSNHDSAMIYCLWIPWAGFRAVPVSSAL